MVLLNSSPTVIAFTKVALPFGWLGNMAPFPVDHDGQRYRTTEALFQALRFEDVEIREAIRREKSPMAAKMVAERYRSKMVIAPESAADVANMKAILQLKLSSHPGLKARLAGTGEATIVEDCSKRPRGSGMFWGAALIEGEWIGENTLGRLWMELRGERSLPGQ